jgi:hypothetical protein
MMLVRPRSAAATLAEDFIWKVGGELAFRTYQSLVGRQSAPTDARGASRALLGWAAGSMMLAAGQAAATSLPPPAGYSTSQLIFEDSFASSSLDTSKWNPWLGDDLYGRWGDQGALSSPYSGMNCDSTCSNSYQIMYYDPYPYGYAANTAGGHLLGGGSGNLALVAKPSSYFGALGYRWASSAVSTYGKAYLPATGGYVQWHAKMADSRYGAWAGLWLLSANGAEMDVQESGYPHGSTNVNNVLASHWQGSGGSQVIQDTGKDLSAAYHTYGIEYIPGKSWTVYLDGQLMATWTSGVPNAQYQVLIDLEIAGSNAAGWHTVADPTNQPGPFELDIDNVQIYSLAGGGGNTTPPSVPTDLRATAVSTTEVDLAWTASSDPDSAVYGYDVYRNGTYLGFSATPAYVDKSVVANTAYTYQVLAYDSAHNASALSLPLTVTTSQLQVGAKVITVSAVDVYAHPDGRRVVCIEPIGAAGTVTSGPQTGRNGLAWWQVAFSGCSGWVLQSSIAL